MRHRARLGLQQRLGAAEIGVVMLLFVIGLELSPARLKVMRRSVFGAGAAQVALSGLVLGATLIYTLLQIIVLIRKMMRGQA